MGDETAEFRRIANAIVSSLVSVGQPIFSSVNHCKLNSALKAYIAHSTFAGRYCATMRLSQCSEALQLLSLRIDSSIIHYGGH